MTEQGQSLLNTCLMALQRMGVKVTTGDGIVTCVFPPKPDDEHAAPDGEEKTWDEATFTLMVTRTFLDLAERGVINPETGAAV